MEIIPVDLIELYNALEVQDSFPEGNIDSRSDVANSPVSTSDSVPFPPAHPTAFSMYTLIIYKCSSRYHTVPL